MKNLALLFTVVLTTVCIPQLHCFHQNKSEKSKCGLNFQKPLISHMSSGRPEKGPKCKTLAQPILIPYPKYLF